MTGQVTFASELRNRRRAGGRGAGILAIWVRVQPRSEFHSAGQTTTDRLEAGPSQSVWLGQPIMRTPWLKARDTASLP